MQSRIQQHLAMQWSESESRTWDAAKSVTKDFAHLVEDGLPLLWFGGRQFTDVYRMAKKSKTRYRVLFWTSWRLFLTLLLFWTEWFSNVYFTTYDFWIWRINATFNPNSSIEWNVRITWITWCVLLTMVAIGFPKDHYYHVLRILCHFLSALKR